MTDELMSPIPAAASAGSPAMSSWITAPTMKLAAAGMGLLIAGAIVFQLWQPATSQTAVAAHSSDDGGVASISLPGQRESQHFASNRSSPGPASRRASRVVFPAALPALPPAEDFTSGTTKYRRQAIRIVNQSQHPVPNAEIQLDSVLFKAAGVKGTLGYGLEVPPVYTSEAGVALVDYPAQLQGLAPIGRYPAWEVEQGMPQPAAYALSMRVRHADYATTYAKYIVAEAEDIRLSSGHTIGLRAYLLGSTDPVREGLVIYSNTPKLTTSSWALRSQGTHTASKVVEGSYKLHLVYDAPNEGRFYADAELQVPNDVQQTVAINLIPGYTLNGRLLPPEGTPLLDPTVTAQTQHPAIPTVPHEQVRVSSDGTFELRDLPATTVTLLAQAQGLVFASLTTSTMEVIPPQVHLPHADEVEVAMVPMRQITVRVEDEQGAPLSGATVVGNVTVKSGDNYTRGLEEVRRTGVTDATGTAKLEVFPSDVNVDAYIDGYRPVNENRQVLTQRGFSFMNAGFVSPAGSTGTLTLKLQRSDNAAATAEPGSTRATIKRSRSNNIALSVEHRDNSSTSLSKGSNSGR